MDESGLRSLLERYVEHHLETGERLSVEELCRDRPELEGRAEILERLESLIRRYHGVEASLAGEAPGARVSGRGGSSGEDSSRSPSLGSPSPGFPPGGSPPEERPSRQVASDEPRIEGFEVVERLGRGGMGEVWKVRDRTLDRLAAAKILRVDSETTRRFGDFLAEARSLALFRDPRIVGVYEYRPDAEPPVLLMEYVEGFPLNRVGPSLEPVQKARLLVELCEAVQHAHDRGIQHRDLKPANLLLDQELRPRILDFGLAGMDPDRGHGVGTLPYMAPEQLDPSEPLDERVDVYALGVVLFELLCGETPWPEGDGEEVMAAIREGRPRLAIEIDDSVPEPLQAVALKAMERDPGKRYSSATEMARDLRRFLEGKPVLARPTAYADALEERIRPHLAALREWLGLDLIYPHEEKRLRREYDRLTIREDDWIVESRVLSWSQIALYLGAFFLVAGGLLYFWAHRVEGAVEGLLHPVLVQGLPFLGLTVAAWFLRRRGHPAVAVAFDLAATVLLPLLLLILLHELGLWDAAGGEAQLFPEGTVTDRQLQVSFLLASLWASFGAWRTRTVALGATAATLWSLFGIVMLADFGLRAWWTEGQWDRLALHLAPIALLEGVAAWDLHRRDRVGFGRALAVAAVLVGGLALELLALDRRMFEILGITLAGVEAGEGDPVLLDTLAALSLNGLLFYAGATALERWGSRVARPAAVLLAVISPFALLEPLLWLVSTDTFSRRWDWIYLALAVGVALLSRHRQRKSFYLAGLLNTGTALILITLHQEWLDDPPWSLTVIVAGLAVLATGFGLSVLERRRRRRPG